MLERGECKPITGKIQNLATCTRLKTGYLEGRYWIGATRLWRGNVSARLFVRQKPSPQPQLASTRRGGVRARRFERWRKLVTQNATRRAGRCGSRGARARSTPRTRRP